LIQAADQGLVTAAHDVSKGGLAIALYEMLQSGGFRTGVKVTLPGGMGGPPLVQLFGEGPSRVILAYELADENRVFDLARSFNLEAVLLGETINGLFVIEPFLSVPNYLG